MGGFLLFPAEEYDARLANVRRGMNERDLEACLITSPENIFYMTGLDHQGYFGTHILVIPREGEMVLFTRAMERPTVERQVGNAQFRGYMDTQNPGEIVARFLDNTGLGSASIGLQKASLLCPVAIAESLVANLPEVQWTDVSGIVEDLRLVKSPRELAYVRQAAAVSDAMTQTAMKTASEGVSEKDISAEVHRKMIAEGGEYPGFGPFIRSAERLPYEHEVWSDRVIGRGDLLFLEMAGCIGRYHAPMGRVAYVGEAPAGTEELQEICEEAQRQVLEAMRPGATGAQVYTAWQDVVDDAGLSHYRRHHCGYAVGIAFPPTWTGGLGVISLHAESDMKLRPGMVFHQLSWLLGCGRGDYFISDTAVVTDDGGELLTTSPRDLQLL